MPHKSNEDAITEENNGRITVCLIPITAISIGIQ
jgi:hypothetical protein